ncbi:TatD family hydrolase [Fusibacter paucivorans]|uniref:TatD family hydrolase n=1 Tax=Fusibacter paucivorans TaxID=76009 RepID=A0ABS5PPM2_9FIRM|nr:Qat anti-phage system TatD family nuclease QatD [Fusibacter paucivorans]MBS7527129.1 TatD family hydrolase [Fusibacter paucivorans]
MLYDMHCHLDLMPKMKGIIHESVGTNFGIMAVTTTPQAYTQEVDFCKNAPNIKVAVGLHPQLIEDRHNELSIVLFYLQKAKYIGEIGLDFNREYVSSKAKQIEVFSSITKECSKIGGKVLSIHSVKAAAAVIDILSLHRTTENNICILHWFTGNESDLKRAIDLGCYFSINSKMLSTSGGKRVIQSVPEDRILVETDAPFIKEISHYQEIYIALRQVIKGMSELKCKDLYDVICQNSENVING